MNLIDVFPSHFLSNDEISTALQRLEITQQDLDCLGQPNNPFVDLLRQYTVYSTNPSQDDKLCVQYRCPADLNLTCLREQYDLEMIAGKGAEIERLISLMHWVHGLAIHTSKASVPDKMDSLHLLHLIHTEAKHINCGMFATILNDVYLALGWKSRLIHLKPYKKDHIESHVVNAVYCQQLSKWLFFDPNLNAYFMDERGEILSVAEIRQRLIDGAVLQINDELAFNSDNKVFAALGQYFGKDFYRFYIAKNIFRYNCPQSSLFGYQSRRVARVYIELLPVGYRPELLAHPQVTTENTQTIYTTDITHFWQQP